MNKKNVLVLCTGNSCRSQMAEGYLRAFLGPRAHVYSAGVESHGVNPKAVEAMRQDGIDISAHTSTLMEAYAHIDFDYVITVCDHAKERCPYFATQAVRLHQNFPDPAKATGSQAEIDEAFVHTRELIKAYCRNFAETYFGSANHP